jgi:hypothetical protein
MPVLDKVNDHDPNRDLEREKDRDREGKDREKGPKAKSSTKSLWFYQPVSWHPTNPALPSFSQGSVPRAVQILQGGLLYRWGVMSIFACKQRTWATKRRLRLVRQGKLQIWSQMRARTYFARSEYVHGS